MGQNGWLAMRPEPEPRGDGRSPEGRSRSIARRLILGMAVGLAVTAVRGADRIIADFESAGFGDWECDGGAFGSGPVAGGLAGQHEVSGHAGLRLANSFHGGDDATGVLQSPPFVIDREWLRFLVGGGSGDAVGVQLLVDGKPVREARGQDSEQLREEGWDVRELQGRSARVRVVDEARGGWGHVLVDQVLLSDDPPPRPMRLEDYRRSNGYYRERWRPQVHFSPEMNWMNDPNGLVFFEGEYHLFYQHNPHGNDWGHMSWGHAVSTDLMHWKHLPIALHEEYGSMCFSGCVVVDRKNSSGFGSEGAPPLVAVFTTHGHGRQTQDLAFSTDRGRSWTRYAGNPVLDLGEADFRDPKVFWHAGTDRWVMVVSLAVQKRLQFYGSANLKDWELLSEFGPAGAAEKPNWECPDLFELPIEGAPGESRWVLEVDVGDGAVAGGSGGEYFIGTFDGKRFVPDDPAGSSQWVDHGRDFYAPVTFSGIPPTDGRTIWIGWMNNWETHSVPTFPWRSAMSIPRSLSLRKTSGGLRLAQRPVQELDALRALRQGEHFLLADEATPQAAAERLRRELKPAESLDLEACFRPGARGTAGLHFISSEGDRTTVGYSTETGTLFVDRTSSGIVDFHPRFAGRHAVAMPLDDGRVTVRVVLDTSSIEVFAGDGTVCISDLIFPRGEGTTVEPFATGDGSFDRIEAWHLESVWPVAKGERLPSAASHGQ